MTSAARRRRARALLWFAVSLLVLLAAGAAVLLARQRGILRDEMKEHMDRETELLTFIISDDLMKRDYVAIGKFVAVFGQGHQEIAGIRVIAPNNYLLASYARPGRAISPETHVNRLADGVALEVVHDVAPVQAALMRTAWQLLWATLIFLAVMGTVLWNVLRRIAFDPLEKALLDVEAANERLELSVAERTAALTLSNEELKEEIAERLAAEEAQRGSEERFRSITETVPDVIYRRRPDGTITYASPAVRLVLGYTPEEAVGMNFRQFITPGDMDRSTEVHNQLLAGLPVREYPMSLLKKSGEVIDAEVNIIPLKNDTGVYEIQGVIRDVTKRKATEAALRSSEARHRLVIENINEIIYQVAIEDETEPLRAKVEFVSGQVESIVGYPADEFLRDPRLWRSIIHQEDLPAIAESTRRLVAERAGGTRVYRIVHGRTGEHIWLEDKVVPGFDERGRITGYFGVARDITKRKKAEDAVQEALVRAEEEKNKSAAIIAAIGDGISIQDRDFKVLYQNDKHKMLIGNHVGEYCFEAYEKRKTVCNTCPVALSFADGKVHTVERRGRTDDGRSVLVEITTSPLRDASGQITAGIEVARDISGRRRMEQDLRVALETQSVVSDLLRIPSEEVPLADVMQQALLRILRSSLYSFHAMGAIFLLDAETDRLSMVAQHGLNDSIREACREVTPGTCLCGRAAASRQIQFASDLDDRHEIRVPGMQPHGHYCVPVVLGDAAVGVLALYLEQGHVRDEQEEEFLRSISSALAVMVQRKRMEREREKLIADLRMLLERVHASRQEWQETFDSIMDPIVLMDGSRAVLKSNRAFSTLCGKRPQEVVGTDVLDLLYSGSEAPQDNPVSRCLRGAVLVNDEIIESRTKRVFHMSVFPFSLSEKGLSGAILVMKDLTDDRDKEIRLIMSERLAALGQMASGIAHEINNPLAAIAGCVDGMSRRINRQQYDPELFKRYVQIIKDEIARSKNITTSMLSFVRKSTYEKKQIDLRDTIERTLEIIGYQGRLRRMVVERHIAPDLPQVYGSEGELRQVLLIIITNALDAMDDSGTLTVTAGFDEQSVFVDVGDTGPGIHRENLARIFDPFFTTKAERGGTGLGLSIAQRIVAAQNGSITVLPDAEIGTTFRIFFPRRSA